MASTADCGLNTRESFASYDPASSSWRTSQLCLTGEWSEFSETWPRAGMTRNGRAYELPMLARPTDESESGSWPTPSVADTMGTLEFNPRKDACFETSHAVILSQMVQHREKWPTPKVQDSDRSGIALRGRHDLRTGRSSLKGTVWMREMWPTPNATDGSKAPKFFAGGNPSLPYAVKIWPTPQAHDAMGGRGSRNLFADGHHYPHDLADAVKWATPLHRDYRSPGKHPHRLPASQSLTVQVGGSLNPMWVEWLMGYPLGWTALEDSEIALCPKLQSGLEGES